MERFNRIAVPAGQKLRQLQKVFHGITNNEGGIMNKFKKLKNKAPPSVPQRDYVSESPVDEEEQWSDDFDSDYENPDEPSDSETYVVPGEETTDDSYEPPPTEKEKRKLPPVLPFSKGEYADNRSNQRHSPPFSKTLPNKASWPSQKTKHSSLQVPLRQKPQLSSKPKNCSEDETDYVVPVEDEDENYIHPTESSSLPSEQAPKVNRSIKPSSSAPPASPPSVPALAPGEEYEVPVTETPPFSPYQKPSIKTCDSNSAATWESKSPSSIQAPSPLPRAIKKTATQLKTAPGLPPPNTLSGHEEKPVPAERHRGRTLSPRLDLPHPSAFPTVNKPIQQKPVPPPKPPEVLSPSMDIPLPNFPANSCLSDQEAEVHCRPWYAGSCDRKSAEAALYKSNKDGSFLIRKSSGHNSKQPYTLVVFYNRRVYNIPVRYIESTKQYALGSKKNGEEHFNSVADIIKNHQHTPLVLIDSQNNTKDSTRLKYAVKVS
ncbi:B-cell linker protein isoform X1 [Phascolarctos cinereus]|uniref:B-cell linker protein isoform X1 n=2 Tax=Phascolarctos cinereus TaxID=38626 RepID=A0A6P5L7L6_PHACI|nr:B-cell linker protein isoform X1 [Phascolarctos cinereus]